MRIICSPQGIIDIKRPKNGMMDIEKAGFTEVLFDTNMGKDGMSPSVLMKAVSERQLNASVAVLMPETQLVKAYTGCDVFIIPPLEDAETKIASWDENKGYYLKYLEQFKVISEDGKCLRPVQQTISVSKRKEGAVENQIPHILLQNLCKEVNGHFIRGVCSDAREAARWIDELNEMAVREFGYSLETDVFGFCVDIGALNLCGQNPYEFICTLGKRIKAVIIRENDGQNDYHMLPFTSVANGQSQMDWLGIIRGLREIGFDGDLIMSFGDTACAFSPLLRVQLMQMAKSVADYIKWQIEIENLLKQYEKIVLFGAGNMCRNYMKCYGQAYLPLFTCDNNKALWGTQFCGLEVKSPEELKALPENTAVFICNVYYREIEQQLREMGLKNPIEYFNDEYMPSFYFDRLE